MDLVPGLDGALEVFPRISPDGVALEADVALEAELTEHFKKGLLVVVATIEGLDELSPTVTAFLGPAGAYLPEQGLGIGEGRLEVGLRLDLQEMAKVLGMPTAELWLPKRSSTRGNLMNSTQKALHKRYISINKSSKTKGRFSFAKPF